MRDRAFSVDTRRAATSSTLPISASDFGPPEEAVCALSVTVFPASPNLLSRNNVSYAAAASLSPRSISSKYDGTFAMTYRVVSTANVFPPSPALARAFATNAERLEPNTPTAKPITPISLRDARVVTAPPRARGRPRRHRRRPFAFVVVVVSDGAGHTDRIQKVRAALLCDD